MLRCEVLGCSVQKVLDDVIEDGREASGIALEGLTSRFGAVRTLAAMHHQQNHIDIAGNLVTPRLNRSRMMQ
jgi:hypothetical protein